MDKKYRLGKHLIDFAAGNIQTGNQIKPISRHAMHALQLLVEQAGNTVERRVFHATVWENQFRTEDVLNQVIRELRRALDDNTANPEFIRTEPRVGYRLLCRPRPADTFDWLPTAGFFRPVVIRYALLAGIFAACCLLLLMFQPGASGNNQPLTDWPLILTSIQFDNQDLETISMADRFDNILAKSLDTLSDHQVVVAGQVDAGMAGSNYSSSAYGETKLLAGNLARAGGEYQLQVRLMEINTRQIIWESVYNFPEAGNHELENTAVKNITARLNDLLTIKCMQHLLQQQSLSS